jgi:hypothetical protein
MISEPSTPHLVDPRDYLSDAKIILSDPESMATQLLSLPPDIKKIVQQNFDISIQGKLVTEIAEDIRNERTLLEKQRATNDEAVNPVISSYHEFISARLKSFGATPNIHAPKYKVVGQYDYAFMASGKANSQSYGAAFYEGNTNTIFFSSKFNADLQEGNLLAHTLLVHEIIESHCRVVKFAGTSKASERQSLAYTEHVRQKLAKDGQNNMLVHGTSVLKPSIRREVGDKFHEGIVELLALDTLCTIFPENVNDIVQLSELSYEDEMKIITFATAKLGIPESLHISALTDKAAQKNLRSEYKKIVGPYAYDILTF